MDNREWRGKKYINTRLYWYRKVYKEYISVSTRKRRLAESLNCKRISLTPNIERGKRGNP